MNVLVIGDEHTYGYGLPEGKLSYLGHFIRQISRTGEAITVEAYAHSTLLQLSSTLAQLPLNRYDLIILQFNGNLLRSVNANELGAQQVAMTILPYPLALAKSTAQPNLLYRFKSFSTTLLSMVWPPYGSTSITSLLNQLRPYRHNVLLLTPLPHRSLIRRWLRKRGRNLLLKEADKQLFSVFDSEQVIRPREEYFLLNDPEHLSAISHELLGRGLFDFYQSAPTIITIQSGRRE